MSFSNPSCRNKPTCTCSGNSLCYGLLLDVAFRHFRNKGELRIAIRNWQKGCHKRAEVVAIYGTIADWDVSKITDMSNLFHSQDSFNEPIGAWNTSAVTTMKSMFYWASAFNQSIGAWHTSAVTNMKSMFHMASAFNQPIGAWNDRRFSDSMQIQVKLPRPLVGRSISIKENEKRLETTSGNKQIQRSIQKTTNYICHDHCKSL